MEHYIPKSALVAEIERRIADVTDECNKSKRPQFTLYGKIIALENLLSFLDTLEMKEVDLEKEIDGWYQNKASKEFERVFYDDIEKCAKYFFGLGLLVNNPTTEADRGTAEEIIINLKRVEQDYRIDLTKEMEWIRNQVKKGA